MRNKSLPWSDVSLRPLDAIPVENFKSWQNNPELRNQTMGFRFPVQLANVAQWQDRKVQENGSLSASFSIFFRDLGVGAIFISRIDWVHRTTELGVYIGEEEAKGRGVGYCACALTLDYVFHALNLRRVGLKVVETNHAACTMYESLGLTREGVDRDAYMLRGHATDVIRFGILSEEFVIQIPSVANRMT